MMKWLTNLIETMTIARQRHADYMVQSMNGTQPIPEHIELKKPVPPPTRLVTEGENPDKKSKKGPKKQ